MNPEIRVNSNSIPSNSIEQKVQIEPIKKNRLLKIFDYSVLVLAFIAPVFFYLGNNTNIFATKLGIIATAATAALLTIIIRIAKNEIVLPDLKIIFSLTLIPIALFISAFFSKNINHSIFGEALEVGTAGSLLLLYALFIVGIFTSDREGIVKKSIWTFLSATSLLIAYTVIHGIIASSFGLTLRLLPEYLIGNFADFSLVLGIAIIFSIYFLNNTQLEKKLKLLLWSILILSLAIIGGSNFKELNSLLLVFSLVIFLYIYFRFRTHGKKIWISRSKATLIVIGALLVFIFFGTYVNKPISKFLNINSVDVRPNAYATLQIIKSEYSKNPIVGSGPNTFSQLWSVYKPLEVNNTTFWNSDFYFGFGFFPTIFATAGIISLISTLIFVALYFAKGIKIIKLSTKEGINSLPVFLFFSSGFLWVANFIYSPGIGILALCFLLTGLFLASLVRYGFNPGKKVNISAALPKFAVSFITAFLIAFVISSEYLIIKRVMASVNTSNILSAYGKNQNMEDAKKGIERSIFLNGDTDLYYRLMSELYLIDIENLASKMPGSGNLSDEQRILLQSTVENALKYGNLAIEKDSSNYVNYINIGKIYESLSWKGVNGAAANSWSAYVKALELNPKNPSIPLAQARIALLNNDPDSARQYINRSIELKNNYTEAYFALAQLESIQNNVNGAIQAVESAIKSDPTNAAIYFQLGVMKYNSRDYIGASKALEDAITLIPNYSNAKYFLGLTYYYLGKTNEAITQFNDLRISNPNNTEVTKILSNLMSGNSPFAGAAPIENPNEEKIKDLPIEEDGDRAAGKKIDN